MTLEIILKNGKIQFLRNVENFSVASTIDNLYIVTFENHRQAFYNKNEVIMIGWKEDVEA